MAKGQIRCISATGARLSCPTSCVVVNTATSGWRPARFPGMLLPERPGNALGTAGAARGAQSPGGGAAHRAHSTPADRGSAASGPAYPGEQARRVRLFGHVLHRQAERRGEGQYTTCDVARSFAVAQVSPEFSAAPAGRFLRGRDLRAFQEAGWPLRRILPEGHWDGVTDQGNEYRGVFERVCGERRIRHARTKPRPVWATALWDSCRGSSRANRGVVESR
jgi:hypothetical protein